MNQGKPAAGFAAGGHYDPAHTKKHMGPLSTAGHHGDLPVLVVDGRGDATEAPRASIPPISKTPRRFWKNCADRRAEFPNVFVMPR